MSTNELWEQSWQDVFPASIETHIQALRLVRKANREKKRHRLIKERALKKLKDALTEVDLADRQLHKAEICRGRLFDIIRSSGFQIPVTVQPLPQPLVYVSPDDVNASTNSQARAAAPEDPRITGNPKGSNANSRPVRAKAGKNGQRAKLLADVRRIRPDLASDDEGQERQPKSKRKGKASFPQEALDNELAPPPAGRSARGRKPRLQKVADSTTAPAVGNKSTNNPQIQRPAVPDEPLQAGPPAPSFQLALAGSQFGFSAPGTGTGNMGQAAQSGEKQTLAQPSMNARQLGSDSNSTALNASQRPLQAPAIQPQFNFLAMHNFDANGASVHDGGVANNATGNMNNMGIDIFAQPAQSEPQGFPAVLNNRNRPVARDRHGKYYHGQDQYMENAVDGQPARGLEDPFNRNVHGIFDDVLPGQNNFTGPFDYEGEEILNNPFMGEDLIPRGAPVSPRSQGYRAQDLFLPEPRIYESDDESRRSLNGDINGDEDVDDSLDGDDDDGNHNDDIDEDDDIYLQPASDHERDTIIEIDEASPSEDEAIALAALHAASPRADISIY
ncbi:hypothetical protein HYPSUDRAFT_205432 [Hypholoma sublateritium FD-334 SS-4]|uniref:Uncharacterized protein n=1 Tax=Hypholoma sublateritium (strain FD-334 SS-4) TaxID=945553 RepID=A0A0D2KUI3_HYPSF|nr:hypothetical protein HYPSUDRAFT_205432 [Hypholoma sublateritium FD-334 SS-4]